MKPGQPQIFKTAYLRTYPQEYQKVKSTKIWKIRFQFGRMTRKYDQDERENTR